MQRSTSRCEVEWDECKPPLQACNVQVHNLPVIDITRRVYLESAGVGALFPDLWPIAVIAVLTLSAAGWPFRSGLVHLA
jgi:hypothetical protein